LAVSLPVWPIDQRLSRTIPQVTEDATHVGYGAVTACP
jgi:hypothetical protein